MTRIAAIAALPLLLALAACEMRREGEEAPATDSPTAESSASPAASILREEDATPAPSPTPDLSSVDITIPLPDGPEIGPRAELLLLGLLEEPAMAQDWPVVLGGHTDSAGNDQANLRASRARAEAVAAWLVEHGVADARIEVIAFGEQNPMAPNALPDGSPNEAGRRSNRRVEVHVAPPTRDGAAPSANADDDA